MKAWPEVSLGDVVEIERSIVAASAIRKGTLFVGLENIQTGGDFVGVRPVEAGELASSKFAFSPDHLLYGKLRPYLAKIARPRFSGVCSTDILPVRAGPKIDRDYLAHFLLTPRMVATANAMSAGANLPRLSPEALADLKVPLPPLDEQRRIAALLDKAEALRAKRRAALAKLDTLNQAVFLDMFGDPATNPKGWPKRTLGELITVGPQNGLYKPATEYGSGTPILRIDGFYDGLVTKLASLKRVQISDDERELYGLRAGEIVINRVNSREYLGKSAIIPTLSEPTVFESNMMRFDVCHETTETVFLIHYLQTDFVREQILRSAKDAINQSSINQQDVKALSILVPPGETQQLFARRVASAARLESVNRDSLIQIEALFASLQHRAFRGEL